MPEPSLQAAARRGGVARFAPRGAKTRDRIPPPPPENDRSIMKNTPTQAAQIFLKAASYIKQYGWKRTGMGTHGKPRCSMGALASAYPKFQWDKDLAIFMYSVLQKELGGISLTEFNAQSQNGTEVALLFEKLAKNLCR